MSARERERGRASQLKFKLLSFPERIEFHYKYFFILLHFLFSWCVLARIPKAAQERALQTSHQPYYSLPSLIMALIPSRWINIFIPSLLKPEGSSTLESNKGRKNERKRDTNGELKKEHRKRMTDGRVDQCRNEPNSKVTKPWQDFVVLPIIRLIYLPLDTIITVLLIIFLL